MIFVIFYVKLSKKLISNFFNIFFVEFYYHFFQILQTKIMNLSFFNLVKLEKIFVQILQYVSGWRTSVKNWTLTKTKLL